MIRPHKCNKQLKKSSKKVKKTTKNQQKVNGFKSNQIKEIKTHFSLGILFSFGKKPFLGFFGGSFLVFLPVN
jgi:hypothetical protein